jgi:aspartyl-tRNA(Asn)/glutamyl-tRNA(Gln) amidotransferase subunit C
MILEVQQVKKIQSLACLNIPSEEIEKYRVELGAIVGWVAQLKEVDVEGVTPMVSVHEHTTPLRADVVVHNDLSQDLMKIAPVSKYGYYCVPKVV